MIAYLARSAFDLDNPRAEDIDLEDTATSLSRLFRWRGSVPVSVAEHSVFMAREASSVKVARGCLVHDLPEAMLGDIPSPLRAWSPEYEEAEALVMACVAERFNLTLPFPAEVRRLDLRARRSEVDQFLPDALPAVRWLRPLTTPLEGWSSARARREFLIECKRQGVV
jgi:5'-deoxynucleotidase YfbR-like HD superfamily hydrolase